MPLHKQKKKTSRNKIIMWTLIIVLVGLMIISFPAPEHVTEVVLYP